MPREFTTPAGRGRITRSFTIRDQLYASAVRQAVRGGPDILEYAARAVGKTLAEAQADVALYRRLDEEVCATPSARAQRAIQRRQRREHPHLFADGA